MQHTNLTDRLFRISALDTDIERQRKLLNIIITGLTAIIIAMFITITIITIAQIVPFDLRVFRAIGMVALSCIAIYYINNRWNSTIASTLLIAILTVAIIAADTPENLTQGRSVFFFIIPIILTAVLLPPNPTFITTGIAAAIITLIAVYNGISPNIPAIAGFFMIALLSWLSSRSLNQALRELRQINANLDHLVIERTNALNTALQQVISESAKSEAILASITDGIIVFDADGHSVSANAALAEFINRTQADLIGHTITEIMSNHVHPDAQTRVNQLFTSNQPSADRINIDWDKKVFALTFAPVQGTTASTGNSLLIFHDITTEAQLQRMKDSLMSMASHELRTPLNAIIGYSDMFVQGAMGPLLDYQMDSCQRILHNGKRMLTLVNNLLDAAADQAGHLTIHPTNTDIRAVIDDIIKTVQVLAESKKIALKVEIDPTVPQEVMSDAQRLSQILMNLTGNAIKFTHEGHVTVALTKPDSDHWALKVIDTGIGIPADAQEYVFDPFRQVDGTVRRKYQGTGLGLSIVKLLVERMHGDIKLQSAENVGTTFTITFPLKLPSPEQV